MIDDVQPGMAFSRAHSHLVYHSPFLIHHSTHPMDEDLLLSLGTTLEREMPITRAMKVEMGSWDGKRLALKMPLEPNRNHQYSAFAGSLNTLCTVVGWGTVFMLLAQKGVSGNVVIRRSSIRYLRPVRTSKIIARGQSIDAEELAFFFDLLESKGKSKIDLAVEISDEQGPYVSFHGSYVVQDPADPEE